MILGFINRVKNLPSCSRKTFLFYSKTIIFMKGSLDGPRSSKVEFAKNITIETVENHNKIGVKSVEQNMKEREQKIPTAQSTSQQTKNKEHLQNNDLKINWSLIISLSAFIATFANVMQSLYFGKRNDERHSLQVKQQKLLIKYGEQQLIVEDYYVPDNQTERRFRSIFQTKQRSLKFLTGLPGNGKSTAIKKLVKQMRQGQKRVFYIHLRNQKIKSYDQKRMSQRQLLQLQELIVAVANQQADDSERQRIFIIDYINRIQRAGTNEQLVGYIQQRLIGAKQQNLSIFLISSSDLYTQNVRNTKGYLVKQSTFGIIQPKSEADMRSAIGGIMGHYGKNKDQFPETIEHMVKKGYNLKEVEQIAHSYKIPQNKTKISNADREMKKSLQQADQPQKDNYVQDIASVLQQTNADKQMKKSLVQADQIKKDMYVQDISTVLQQNKFKSGGIYDVKLLKSILSLPQTLDINDCLRVRKRTYNSAIQTYYQRADLHKALQELGKMDLLTFCHPRSAFVKQTLIELIQQLEGVNQDINKKIFAAADNFIN